MRAATRPRSKRRCSATTFRPSVVHNLIQETKAGVEPFRRYHRLRRRVLGLDEYFVFDGFVPLVDHDVRYRYDEVLDWITRFGRPLGERLSASACARRSTGAGSTSTRTRASAAARIRRRSTARIPTCC